MSIFYRQLIFAVYFCLITFLFVLPGSAFPKHSWLDELWFDKWVHIGLFSVLCFITCWVWQPTNPRFYFVLLLAAAVYGITIEIIQDKFIPNRSMDLGDWLADILGSIVGIVIWRYKTRTYVKK